MTQFGHGFRDFRPPELLVFHRLANRGSRDSISTSVVLPRLETVAKLNDTSDALAEGLQSLRLLQPSNPKRTVSGQPDSEWYGYYAGYADQFVAEVVRALPEEVGTVLDPWNGSGTTTSVASAQGISSRGIDLNPAAVLIAKARLLGSDVADSLLALTDEIISAGSGSGDPLADDDPLAVWFADETASQLRRLERRMYELLVSPNDNKRIIDLDGLDGVSTLAALFYLGLFRTIRPLLAPFRTSNPTWIRRRVRTDELVVVPESKLAARFQASMDWLTEAVRTNGCDADADGLGYVETGSSSALPLEDESIDAVITSPPYCTRIDYVIATLPELAALGLRESELKELRDRMIGTPTLTSEGAHEPGEVHDAGNSTVDTLITRISQHSSRASQTYYRRFYAQYFEMMRRSLEEISRVARPDAPIVLVAQDSFYKEIHVDLPTLFAEMGSDLGWRSVGLHDFSVQPGRNYAGINPHSRAYRDATVATESVLIFSA
jgi:hypothetical protein